MNNWKKHVNLEPNSKEYQRRKEKHKEERLISSIHCMKCGGFKTRCACKVK